MNTFKQVYRENDTVANLRNRYLPFGYTKVIDRLINRVNN